MPASRAVLLLIPLAACNGGEPTDSDTDPVDPWAGHPILADRYLNIAHRCGALLMPEETIEACRNAADVGVDLLEIDVWSTSDDVLVLMHDGQVDRTTDGTGSIRDFTWAELQELDAGYWFTTDGETYPYRGQGIRVARLEDVLAEFPDMLFTIEPKQQSPSIIEPLHDLLVQYDAIDRTLVGSFDPGPIEEMRALDPSVLTAMTVGEGLAFYQLTEADEATYEPPARVLAAPLELGSITLDAATFEKAARHGVSIEVWTINDRAEMASTLDMGAKAIITDDPVTLKALYEERGLIP